VKVFCGGDNDFLRLRKDWNVFPIGVVDVQIMWLEWKKRSRQECYASSKLALKCLMIEKRALKKNRNPVTEEDLQLYFGNMEKIGFNTLCQIFFPDFQKSHLATLADWTFRPLHPGLIAYAADDSDYLWKLFHLLAKLVRRKENDRRVCQGSNWVSL
jgi:hypothetical protein